ncbi:ABC-type transporter Mla maintaining outer membrane lipid asymmetry, periplasmic component MlaD [Lentimicrobium saccharophilum]|uniref:ABC-type transporter Mla maintaining outer membrane lipid asymmetry, periplasmic component MlaD n=1 Tax=Lentimicrobium saccharophilum TaxID=1678841 RepID=A0A0S7C504_9BACT|nr:MlaD family protein [Lentimicrobium saccharophilum]GAP45262.1 ABC-type transporter Mla maintaining outer membrane lipid asymmetry, periplasmic component MlaD [Lentimicrobium saccharophilum]
MMKHFKFSREIRVGLLTLVTLAAFIWSYNFLKGRDVFKRQRTFYAVYDNVAGMMTANAITINGLEVGQVSRMYFHPQQPGRVVVELFMSNDIPIPRNSAARIYSSDLLGTRRIQIIPGDSPEFAESGDTLIGQMQQSLQDEVNDMVEPIMRKTENLITSFDTVLNVLSEIFNKQTRDNLTGTVESLRNTMASLENATLSVDTLVESQKIKLARIIDNIESISANLKQNGDNFNRILSNTASISDTIARSNISATLSKLTNSIENLEKIVAGIEKGEGTVGQLINNDKMYNELEASSRELKLLLEDMRLHPERYVHVSVFGRNPRKNPYQPPAE